MCPNTEFYLVRIFPHSDWMRRDTEHLSVFSLNAGKQTRKNSVFGHFSRSVGYYLDFMNWMCLHSQQENPYVQKEKLIQSLRNFHSIILGLIKNYFCDKRPSIEQENNKMNMKNNALNRTHVTNLIFLSSNLMIYTVQATATKKSL